MILLIYLNLKLLKKLPKKDGLKVILKNFMEDVKKKQYNEMAFKIALELYSHYKILYISYIYC